MAPGNKHLLDRGFVLRDRWEVIKKLGEGGFGAVYEVEDKNRGLYFALKTESTTAKNEVLRMEVQVLKALSGKTHCVELMGCGRTQLFNFVIMGLVGENLGSLRKKCNKEGKLTRATTVRLGLQAIEAVEDIHSVGFLHRDVKPSNFAVGRSEATQRTIFLIDFGLSRPYMTAQGGLRPPRQMAGFRGTLRYCSLSAHKGIELGRQDDLISTLFMMVEMLKGGLPWRCITDKLAVRKLKETTPAETLFDNECPPELLVIWKYVTKLEYAHQPNYKFIKEQLKKVMVRKGYKESDPYDWEEGGKGFEYSRMCPPPDPDAEPTDPATKTGNPAGKTDQDNTENELIKGKNTLPETPSGTEE